MKAIGNRPLEGYCLQPVSELKELVVFEKNIKADKSMTSSMTSETIYH